VFAAYPRVVQVEQAVLGEIMETSCTRKELPSIKGEQARVVIEFRSRAGVD
ncbi:MAG: hypothetical protein RLY69_502, partial [Verrucomicrobiota bacterium]